MPHYRETGIVLRTYKSGEADRVVVLLTAGRGQVRAIAKGARKPTSKFGGRIEAPSHLDLQLHEGRGELHTVSQAVSIDLFRPIRDDLDRLMKAAVLCEVVDQFSRDSEHHDTGRLFQMLLGALRSLAENDSALLVPAFLLKVLALEGFAPQVNGCVTCGEVDDLIAFDAVDGGLVCREHRRGTPVSPEVVPLLRRILGGGLAGALTEPASVATHQIDALARAVMEHHLERRLRSTRALEVR